MHEELRAELLRREAVDQEARGQLVEVTKEKRELPRELMERLVAIDRDNTAWVRGVIREHGWPGRSLVGEQAANAAWLLVQHADHEPAFQRECLDLLQAAVDAGEGSAQHLAYLTDRVLLAEGKPQRYGTQFTAGPTGWEPRPLEDPDNVDARRAEAGLPSLMENTSMIREAYGDPPASKSG